MYNFIKAEPTYTGGNIYVFQGQVNNNQWFLADSCNYDVRLINTDVFNPDIQEEIWYDDWQEKHLIEDLNPTECLNFFTDLFKWIEDNQPSGNYDMAELKICAEEVEELKTLKNWR